ncbi:MAG TPA: hypothetical protein VI979_02340 [archaeon]|nr:hypothetical protein [archaeon]
MVSVNGRNKMMPGREITDKSGQRFHVLVMPREVVLVPIPKDPLKPLREEGRKIPTNLTIKDLKRMALKKAMREA